MRPVPLPLNRQPFSPRPLRMGRDANKEETMTLNELTLLLIASSNLVAAFAQLICALKELRATLKRRSVK